MTEQFSLAGFDSAPASDQLFLAIIPEPDAAARITELDRQIGLAHGLGGKSLRPDRLHLTLCALGDHVGLPAGVVASAKEAASAVTAAPFEVTFDQVKSFTGKKGNEPLVLCSADPSRDLAAFWQNLMLELKRVGLGRFVNSSFTPHIALRYGDKIALPQAVEPIRWAVREFVLIHSLLGKTQHIRLSSWSLKG